ncbi:MAG: DNA polymerase III subunit alpha [Thermodesulfobacteriota bacterium]
MHHSNFVHLHIHTEFSLLDGAIRLEKLFSKARDYKMPAIAMTDHGNMFGAIQFYTKAETFGIKPIIGCELYIAPKSRFDKKAKGGIREASYHLILLAKNIKGYRNLCKLVTAGYLEGFYYRPRIDKDLLKEHHEGLIALSACLHGEIPHLIQKGDMKAALKIADEYKTLFDDRRFFLELMDNSIPEQAKANQSLLEIGKKLDIPVVATNDCHYIEKKDNKAHDGLLCIQTGKTIDASDRMRFSTDDFYLKSPAEMTKAFESCPEAIQNTIEIAERCNLELHLGEHHFPVFPVPDGETLDAYLERAAREGLEERINSLDKQGEELEHLKRVYYSRLDKELDIIKSMGYSGYFLIVSDFINFARDRHIPVGPGRGSVGGSLVAYALKITAIDPIRYNLIFERFLNPERISMPDIDIDFCIDGREEVIKYVSEKYGKDNVAQIITFGKMQAKAVIRDVGRVMSIPYGEVDRVAKLIPSILNMTIENAIKQEPKLKELIEKDPKIDSLIQMARVLEGLNRHASTHAAGVVISNRPLVEYLPLYKGQKDEVITTQYAMNDVEKIGLLKFDFLGLKTLTVIDNVLKLIKSNKGEDLDIDIIPVDDLLTYQLLASGATNGVFQLESSGIKDLLVRLKPEDFEDIIAIVALYRPGPLGSGMVDDFIKRKHGKTKIRYELPELKPILEPTYGVIVYQEQVMQVATSLANFSPGDSDILRRAMGKKKPEEMAEQKEIFLTGAKKNKIPAKKAEKIFNLIAKFAGYGFNKSHSAAYALIAYQTAYLKTHYPVEFMTGLLTSEMGNTDKVIKYIGECKSMGIEVLPPNVNESYRDFTAIGDKIRFGLAAVKNVGGNSIDAVVKDREKEGSFQSFMDFCIRIDQKKANKRVIESLIKGGAFDFASKPRAQLMISLDKAIELAQSLQRDKQQGQASLFAPSAKDETDIYFKELDTDSIEEWPETQRLSYEREALGFYITGHPLTRYLEEIKRFSNADTESLNEKKDKEAVMLGGMVSSIKEINTKKGDRMAFVTLEDLSGSVELIVFSDVYLRSSSYLKGDSPVMVTGTIDKGEEKAKIIVKDIFPLDQAEERSVSKVFFNLDSVKTTKDELKSLKDLMRGYPGNCTTFLNITLPQGKTTVIALPEEYSIKPSKPLFKAVKDLLGYDAVRLT